MFEQFMTSDFVKRVAELFTMETSTLIGVMVWGNLILSMLMHIFQHYSIYCDYKKPIRQIAVLRLAYALGYFLLFVRGSFPDILSVNLGNTILFICMYYEMRMIMIITSEYSKAMKDIYTRVLIAALIFFNIMSFAAPGKGMLVFCASIIIYLLYFIPCMKLITSVNTTRLKRNMGIFYEVCILILVPRAAASLMNSEIGIHSDTVFQTIFFLILNVFMLTSTLMFFLFVKEKTDKKVEQLANRDDLTGLYNRRYFSLMGTEILQQHIGKAEVTLLFLDVDYFKQTNDRFGHNFGDKVLNEMAQILLQSTRTTDLCCRYGGEEFAVLLSGVNEEGGGKVADRILQEVRNIRFEEEPEFRTTVSIGIYSAVPRKADELADYLYMADRAMYECKEQGRDQKLTYHK